MKLTRLVGQAFHASFHRSPPVIPPQRPNVISSEAEKSKPAVGSRGTYGSPALALNPSLSRLSGAGRNPAERGDARMKESPDETNPLSRPGLPPQRPNVIPPQPPMSFRAKPRNPSPRLAVAAHMAPLRSHLTRPSPVFPAQAGTQGSAGTRE